MCEGLVDFFVVEVDLLVFVYVELEMLCYGVVFWNVDKVMFFVSLFLM